MVNRVTFGDRIKNKPYETSFRKCQNFQFLIFICSTALGQSGSIKGNLREDTGDAVIRGNVILKGTTQGTITDQNGDFLIAGRAV